MAEAGDGNGGAGNRVLPLMREAVLMARMLLHRHLLADLAARRPELAEGERTLLAGAVGNNLFGTAPEHDGAEAFARNRRVLVEEELRALSGHLGKLAPLLTDALRMHCICEEQEGRNAAASLLMARALGILDGERPVPMPSTFMLSVRAAAVAEGLVLAMALPEEGG